MTLDAISLWASSHDGSRAGAGQQLPDDRVSSIEGLARETIRRVRLVDASLAFLKSVGKGGAYTMVLYRLDCLYWYGWGTLRGGNLGILSRMSLLLSPRSPDVLSQERQRLVDGRAELVQYLGSLLSGRAVAGPLPASFDELPLHRPSWLSRYLVPGLGVGALLLVSFSSLRRINWGDVAAFSKGLIVASKNLLQDWIINPFRDIWKTIRYRNSNLALVSGAALAADMESLERMVINFARKHYPTIAESEVAAQVRTGDVTLMLRRYETELQAPLKNILLGDMVSMLLIQVQKSKVDLESAMMAMDRLLKANELNFELLAVIPLFIVLYYLYRTGHRLAGRSLHRAEQQRLAMLKEEINRLERILNISVDEEIALGETIISAQSILETWQRLPKNWHRQYDEELYQDLSELLSMLPSERKLWTVARMYHFYPFLP